MEPPIGLQLLGKSKMCIGKLIGKGAFGQVHAVVMDGEETQWACKLTAVPIKKTKKGDSAVEIAFQRLWSEYLLYSQHCRHLAGVILPKLPSERADGVKLYHDNLNGYRYLVMERMQSLLFDALPHLVAVSTKTVNLGPVTAKLLTIVEAIHETGHILLDVKPDNLMVCANNTAGRKLTPESFASSIRLVDLGLVKSYGGPHGHKENVGCADVQGTPLYAGLNVHALETPSRRDDVEAMLYLIGDLVLTVCGIVHRTPPPHGRGEAASHLPWSQETSDAAIGKAKAEQVGDPESDYYASMPQPAAAALYAAYQVVRGYKYGAKPNYETLRRLLGPLQVALPPDAAKSKRQRATAKAATAAAAAPAAMPRSRSKKAAAAGPLMSRSTTSGDRAALAGPRMRRSPGRVVPSTGQPTSRRATRSSVDAALDDGTQEESPPPKVAKTSTSRFKVDESDFDSDVSMEDFAKEDESFSTAAEDMIVDDDDDEEEGDNRKPAAKTIKFRGIKLVVSGPGFVETVMLVEGGTESIVVGSKPVNSNGETLELNDSTLEASHVRFTISKIHNGVQVDPISKKSSVQVNRMNVLSSGTTAFCGQRITFGDNVVDVKNLRKEEYAATAESFDENFKPSSKVKKTASDKTEPAAIVASSARSRRSTSSAIRAMSDTNVATASPPSAKKKSPTKAKARQCAIVKISSGPNSGAEYILEQGICTTFVVGSAPTRKGHPLKLVGAKGVAPNHTCLDLVVNGQTIMVKVTDLKSDSGTILNGKLMASGKNEMAFCGSSSIQVGDTVMNIVRG